MLGAVLAVQFIPSGEVIILVLADPLLATATNNVKSGLQHIPDHVKSDVEFLTVQLTPSGDVNILLDVPATNKVNSGTQHIEYTLFESDVVVTLLQEYMFLIGLVCVNTDVDNCEESNVKIFVDNEFIFDIFLFVSKIIALLYFAIPNVVFCK